jgi:hypothetical protein
MTVSGLTASVQSVNGDVVTPEVNGGGGGRVQDSNGNVVSTISLNTFVDTLGSTAVTASGSPSGTSYLNYTYTGPAGESETVSFTYSSFPIRTNFQCSNVIDYGGGSGYFVTSISLPDGSHYSFTYESTPGYPGSVTGRITSVTFPTGGTVSYQYSGGTNGINCADGSPAILTRITPDGTWVYNHSVSGSPGGITGSATTVTDPGGNQQVLTFAADLNQTGNFYETQRLAYQGSSSSGTLLLTRYNCYNGNLTNCTSSKRIMALSKPR